MNNKRSFEDIVLSTTSAASQSNKRHKQSNFRSPSQEIARSRLDLNEKPIESNEGSEGRSDITKQCATSSISQNTHAINNTCNALDMNLKITKALPVDVNKGLVNIGLSCAKSASFGHMICQHDSVTQNEPTSTSVVPRITNLDESTTATKDRDVFVHHTEERFEGFINSQEQRVGRDEGYSNINPALKIPSIACIAQQYADSGSLNGSTKERTVDFEELSKKYHFLEDGFPSFRLVEFEDDNGKTIDEPELWRPVGMGLEEYKNKINEANSKARMSELKESTTKICEESIQCAQKQRSESLKIESEYEHYVTGDRAIQIVSDSPAPHVSSEWLLTPRSHRRNQMPSDSTSKVEKYGFSKSVLMGRKLFTESSEYGLSHGKRRPYNMSPEVEFIRERINSVDAMSPEVEYLGQRRRAVTNSPEVEFLGQSSKRDVSMSPGVECLGEICFNNVCNNMSDAIDDLYNAGLSLGYRSVSSGSGKENRAPKRVITRITYLCSPFEINNTSRIEPNDIKLYETITTLCDDPIYGDYWVVNMNNYRVTLKQLGCSMKQDGWVEAWVINAYCRKLFKDLHPRKSQKHYFFHTTAEYFLEKWPNEYMRKIWHDNVVKGFQGADSARKLHLSKRLHFPSLYDRHWFLFSVDLKARKFLFMDSLLGESSRLHKEVDERMIKNFTQTRDECKLKDMHFETFDKMYPKLPKQKTSNDCGVFLIKFMELFCTRNPQSCSFSTKDITEFHLEIGINTLFNEHNSAHNYMESIKTFDIEAYRRNQISQQ